MTQTIPYNLPTLPTPFLGRESELAEITALLAEPSCRLLTLLGPGGIGSVPIHHITGSEGRSRDFNADFHPVDLENEDSWVGIATAR